MADTKSFDMSKHIVIAEMSFFGGKDLFLGVMFIGGGLIVVMLMIFMIVMRVVMAKKERDKVREEGYMGKW